eukprot:GHRR01004907.1.p1 GENE.GHRR01004907.1~~GHRR01004907.1.p1  ORF type:complete len:146 (+),score=30.48 GHRR01004907.1:119-556(+)
MPHRLAIKRDELVQQYRGSLGLSGASAVLQVLSLVVIILAAAKFACRTVSESIIVLRGVGVLLMSRRCWGGCCQTFLDLQDIHSVLINESLTTTNIHVHLVFLLHSSDELAVAFSTLSPGLKVLIPVYRELQQMLDGSSSTSHKG